MFSDDLREMIAIEREQMVVAVASLDRVRDRLGRDPSDHDLVVAAGAYVQSLYVGIEKILILIAREYNLPLARSESWHAELLDLYTEGADGAVLNLFPPLLRSRIDDMRGFRHLFRNSYSQRLNWLRLEPVASTSATTVNEFFRQVDAAAQRP